MALPKHTELHYRIWHYFYLFICGSVFFFLIAPLFVIFPLSFNAEEFLSFSDGMKSLDPDAFSLRWYKDMIYGRRISHIDEIQIKRWKNFRRHVLAIEKNCEKNDLGCRRRQRQAILQWAYNPFI